MTKNTLTCPHCGYKMTLELPEQILVTNDVYASLMQQSLFKYPCHQCGAISEFLYPLTFYSEQNNYVIRYTNGSVNAHLEAFITISNDGSEKMLEESTFDDEILKLRFASNINDVCEKITMFKTGYNDKIMEICKQQIIKQNELEMDYQLTYRLSANGRIYFIGQDNNRFSTSMITYNDCEQIYHQVIATDAKLDEELVIDAKWAQKILEVYDGK